MSLQLYAPPPKINPTVVFVIVASVALVTIVLMLYKL